MPSYVRLPKLTSEQLESFKELQSELRLWPVSSHRRRMGASKEKKLSVYSQSKWFNWTAEQRKKFKEAFPDQRMARAMVGYFIEFPAKTGFLDLQKAWLTTPIAGTMVCYALENEQCIIINGERIIVRVGEGISFNLVELHEVPTSPSKAVWANTMIGLKPEALV